MGIFDNILSSNESLFKDEVVLSFDYIPKLVPYREAQQKHIASCISPLFNKRNGKNIFVCGRPGIGKTVALKHVLAELEEKTDEIIPIYINCWQKNTSFKIAIELCGLLGHKLVMSKRTEELFAIAKQTLNKKEIIFVFDEVDKLEEFDILYSILEGVYRKTVIVITNGREWLNNLDARVKSRLAADILEFNPYDKQETEGILKQRIHYAFVAGVWDPDAFSLVVNKTAELGDIRAGLYLLKESGEHAESRASRKVTKEHAQEAILKLQNFHIKDSECLDFEAQTILNIVKTQKNETKSGDIFKQYQDAGGKVSYKTFHRIIKKLEKDKFILIKKLEGGKEGTTSLIRLNTGETKKLTDF